MADPAACVAVLDVGKTNAKLTLWNRQGVCVERRTRPNETPPAKTYRALDLDGIEAWVVETLRAFSRLAPIEALVPVTHGAAAVLVFDGAVFTPPMDYEDEIPPDERADYDQQRDPFALTGSPALPCGLNLGAQLDRLERLTGPWPDGLQILTFPQYWGWRFSGVAASEVTSLGVHTDLWRPLQARFSDLAIDRGWAARFPPLRSAGETLGPITAEWADRTGLPADCRIICGLHDSNAALLAARRQGEISEGEAATLSTGTWFVILRSLARGATADLAGLDERRDCLVNVDVFGRPVPSARFMGGREAELIAGLDRFQPTADYDPAVLISRLPGLLAEGVMVLPSFVPGVGPFPTNSGRWCHEPQSPDDRRAALELYLALVADECLGLIGSKGPVMVEGRFSEAEVFVRALAALRPDQPVYVAHADDDVSCGALRLLDPDLSPPSPLDRVRPLDLALDDYRRIWRSRLGDAAA